ncbi:MAG: sigma-54-dependent Fis family transcriptional regulator [Candidatus Eisenbacteria bacterium]|uniref:Sigma-54-dependent Fis family transcriptional regulator n=1 Tax=Eiseniibacteriota bacterium TaxID=2212470 RepID=A0A937X740_UNCEI|nr:sigma-54-dependent Fis family transcriptional regulator [Candidatus Eisenbacteria bacterium]
MAAGRPPAPPVRAVALIVTEREAEGARLAAALAAAGLAPIRVESHEAALNALDRHSIDALVARLRSPRIRGLQLVALARERQPHLGAVLIIDKGEEEQATQAMRRGVSDFVARPVNADKVAAAILQALERQRLAAELERARRRLELRFGLAGLIGDSGAMIALSSRIREIAPLECPILVTGEAGTGKSLLARVIHQHSLRRSGPFGVCDCEALPPRLAPGELFGPPAGGRGAARPGRLQLADQGTLHLRQVASLPKDLQGRVAEVLQTGMLRPGLAREPLEVRVRLVASSRTGLDGLVGEERLHEGLYALLCGAHIALPPLRHRRRDIPLLACHFLGELAEGDAPPAIDAEALDLLEAYSWPGNVAELQATMRQALLQSGGSGRIRARDLPADIRHPRTRGDAVVVPLGSSLEDAEKRLIEETMRMTAGNREQAAKILRVSLRTFYRKLKRLGIVDATSN